MSRQEMVRLILSGFLLVGLWTVPIPPLEMVWASIFAGFDSRFIYAVDGGSPWTRHLVLNMMPTENHPAPFLVNNWCVMFPMMVALVPLFAREAALVALIRAVARSFAIVSFATLMLYVVLYIGIRSDWPFWWCHTIPRYVIYVFLATYGVSRRHPNEPGRDVELVTSSAQSSVKPVPGNG